MASQKALLEDENVQKLIEKKVTQATKAERNRVLAIVRDHKKENQENEVDKAAKKSVRTRLTDIVREIRDVA